MTGYGPPDDPSEAPTGLYNYGRDGDEQPEPGSTPWYRRRAALIGLSALVAILLAVVIYEIVDLTHTGGSTTPSTSSTTSAAVTTTPPVPQQRNDHRAGRSRSNDHPDRGADDQRGDDRGADHHGADEHEHRRRPSSSPPPRRHALAVGRICFRGGQQTTI